MPNPRTAFIEAQFEDLESARRNEMFAANVRPDLARDLAALADKAVVANFRNGKISLPKDSEDGVLVAAIKRGESFSVGDEFLRFSDSQVENARQGLEIFGLSKAEINKILDIITNDTVGTEIKMGGNMPGVAAQARSLGHASTSDAVNRFMHVDNFPPKKLIKFILRPLIVLSADRSDDCFDVLGHELIHIGQKERKPLRVYGSQDEINMDVLGEELESYHVGAGLRKTKRVPRQPLIDPHKQIKVERFRKKELGDSFEPTPEFLKAITKPGDNMETIISYALNFEQTMAAVRK